MSQIPSSSIPVSPDPTPAPAPLTADLLVGAFAAAGVTGANVSTVIPLAVVVAQTLSGLSISPQQFAAFVAQWAAQTLAQKQQQKAALLKQQAQIASQISATGV